MFRTRASEREKGKGDLCELPEGGWSSAGIAARMKAVVGGKVIQNVIMMVGFVTRYDYSRRRVLEPSTNLTQLAST